MHELRNVLDGLIGAIEPDTQPKLFDLVEIILEDYKVWWGDPMMYQQDVLRGHARRMKGIPTYAYWASLLDPRTKVKAAKLLTARERCMIWKDIQDAICSITETHTFGSSMTIFWVKVL